MYSSTHALGRELAVATQASHLAAAHERRAGRRIALARRATRQFSRRRLTWVPAPSLWRTGRPAV